MAAYFEDILTEALDTRDPERALRFAEELQNGVWLVGPQEATRWARLAEAVAEVLYELQDYQTDY